MKKPNLDKIKEIAGGTASFEQEMISIIKEELPAELEQYQFHLEQNNFKQTAESVHKLKHKISILNMEEAYATAAAYENELRAENPTSAPAFKKIIDELNAFVKKL